MNKISKTLLRKSSLTMLFFFFCVIPSIYAQEISLNAAWDFVKSEATTPKALKTDDWYTVNIPHSWNTIDGFDEENGYYQNAGWYKKEIVFQKTGRDNIFLKFEGANLVTDLFVNGKKVGQHRGGYAGFVFDITPFINWDSPNSIAVRVDNSINPDVPPQSADFTFYGGIYRDIWLVRKGDTFFDITDGSTKGIYISQETTAALGKLTVLTKLKSSNSAKQKKQIIYTLLDAEYNEVAFAKEKTTIEGREAQLSPTIELNSPTLWSPESPYLYTLKIQLQNAKTGTVEDEFIANIGFRWLEMADDRSFLLNGEPIKLIGTNHHQDFPHLANALPDHILRNDLQMIKDMGSNFIRIAHYQHDPSFLEMCDRIGLLAWEEIPVINYITPGSTAYIENAILMLQELIRQHYNHTSIVMWGYMNEILLRQKIPLRNYENLTEETYYQQIQSLAQKLDSVCKAEDPHRFTTIAHTVPYDRYQRAGLNEITDIVSWNLYHGWYMPDMEAMGGYLDDFHAKHPDKGIIISEYGAGNEPRIHATEPWRFDFSVEGATDYHRSYFRQFMERPFVGGATVWNFADFGSESRYDAVPSINNKGLVTFDRQPKDSYLFYRAALSETPYLKIGSEHWQHRVGIAERSNTQPVFVFTNQDKITARVNGKSLGEVEVENFQARIEVPFTSGANHIDVTAGNLADQATFQMDLIPKDLTTLATKQVDLAMNLGAHFHFYDPIRQQAWLPEQAYQKGSFGYVGGNRLESRQWGVRIGVGEEIFGSDLEPVYQTHRDTIQSFKADVPDGYYEITLHFAEIYSTKDREQLAYNLGGEGEQIKRLTARDFQATINEEAPIKINGIIDFHALPIKCRVWVRNGEGLTIRFLAESSSAFLNGIEIRGL